MKPFKFIKIAATLGLMSLALGALGAYATPANAQLDDASLSDWQAVYAEIKDMNPKWGLQGEAAIKTSMDAGVPIVFVDVRTPQEWSEGILPGALMISLHELPTAQKVAMLPADKNAIIAIYCKSGHRSAMALTLMHQLGYKNATSMSGGWVGWSKAGYPVAAGPAVAK